MVNCKTKELPEDGDRITDQVEAIPKNADADHWLVASNVTITNRWSTDLEIVKAGIKLIFQN